MRLARDGVLVLDDLPAFDRRALLVVAEAIDAERLLLVATMRPCPCGRLGDSLVACQCSPREVARYWSKVEATILERFEIVAEVAALLARRSESAAPHRRPAALGSLRPRRLRCGREDNALRWPDFNGPFLDDLDQMETEASLHWPHKLARLGCKGRLLELRRHPAATEEAQVAAPRGARRVVGDLGGNGHEVLSGREPGADRGQLLARLVEAACLVHPQQDVPRSHLFLLAGLCGRFVPGGRVLFRLGKLKVLGNTAQSLAVAPMLETGAHHSGRYEEEKLLGGLRPGPQKHLGISLPGEAPLVAVSKRESHAGA